VQADLDRMHLPTVGHEGPRWFAVTAVEARQALRRFVDRRLAHFGPHEDAMLTADWAMVHTLLTVPLNIGLLHPLDAVRAAEGGRGVDRERGGVRPAGAGWREYVRQLDWRFGRGYPRRNARTPLPSTPTP
jgi:deoxyribodipyrimidine photolyase-related protein